MMNKDLTEFDPIRIEVSKSLAIKVNVEDIFKSRQYKRICEQSDKMWKNIEKAKNLGIYPR